MSKMLKPTIILIALLSLAGCDNKMNSKSEAEKVTISYEMGLLPRLMSIPGKPVSVKWELDESRENAGNLVALLEYSTADKQNIITNSNKVENPSSDRIDAEFYDNWLPEEAKKGIETNKIEGVYELKGVIPLLPNLFTQTELSPYVNGSVTPLAGGYILVALYAM